MTATRTLAFPPAASSTPAAPPATTAPAAVAPSNLQELSGAARRQHYREVRAAHQAQAPVAETASSGTSRAASASSSSAASVDAPVSVSARGSAMSDDFQSSIGGALPPAVPPTRHRVTSAVTRPATAQQQQQQQPRVRSVAAAAQKQSRHEHQQPPAAADATAAPTEGQVAFFAEFFARQASLKAGDVVIVKEHVYETLQGGHEAAAPQTRYIYIRLGGDARATSRREKLLLDAFKSAAAAPPRADATVTETHLSKPQNKRAAPLLQFPACTALDPAVDVCFNYGAFPLAPLERRPHNGGHRVEYLSLRVLPAAEAAELPASFVLLNPHAGGVLPYPTSCDPGGQPLWTSEVATDEHVEDTLRNKLGTSAQLTRADDGAARQAFRLLAARTAQGYRTASLPEERDKIMRRVIALPRMFLRRYEGSASPRIRERHLREQLTGSVCTQRVVDQRPRAPRPTTEDEHAKRCVGRAFGLASQSFLSRASKALTAKYTPNTRAPADMLPDLRRLHPDGAEPDEATLPAVPAFNAQSFDVASITKFVGGNLRGSAPGPDGWSYELLFDALGHEGFAAEFHAMVVDICNGAVTPDTALVLAASTLVGIPKGQGRPEDGTRPIALGSVFLKVAEQQAWRAAGPAVQRVFADIQFGTAPAGTEVITHTTREYVRTGKKPDGTTAGDRRVVFTIDFANAFNTPTRAAMWKAAQPHKELHGIFWVSYRKHAPLYARGTGVTITSASGSRQGTFGGGGFFSLTAHPVLVAAHSSPGNFIQAFFDDITDLADDPECADTAANIIIERARAIGLEVNLSKCEVFTPGGLGVQLPAGSILNKFKRVEVVKLLGSSIAASDADEAAHLLAREGDKTALFFERVRNYPCPQFFNMLRLCGVPSLAFFMRVHSGDVSRPLAQRNDALTEDLFAHWASITVADRQRIIMSLPVALGGMGLTRLELIGPAAYHASRQAALNRKGRPIKQAQVVEAVYNLVYRDVAKNDAALHKMLQQRALHGGDAGLSFPLRWHPDTFGAHLRTEAMAVANVVGANVEKLDCPGCKSVHAADGDWGQHVSCCVRTPGGLVTKRHNGLVAYSRTLLSAGGCCPDAKEPRDFAIITCQCNLTFSYDEFVKHRLTCPFAGKTRNTSGPDFRWYTDGKTYVGDITIINPLLASFNGTTTADALTNAAKGKFARYGDACARAGVVLKPLPATSNGHLAPETVKFFNVTADLAFLDRRGVRNHASALIARGSADARIRAEQLAGCRPLSVVPPAEWASSALRCFAGVPDPTADIPVDPMALSPERVRSTEVSLDQRIADGLSNAFRNNMAELVAEVFREIAAKRAAEAEAAAVLAQVADADGNDVADEPVEVMRMPRETQILRAAIAASAEVDDIARQLSVESMRLERVAAQTDADTIRATDALMRDRVRACSLDKAAAERAASIDVAARHDLERLQICVATFTAAHGARTAQLGDASELLHAECEDARAAAAAAAQERIAAEDAAAASHAALVRLRSESRASVAEMRSFEKSLQEQARAESASVALERDKLKSQARMSMSAARAASKCAEDNRLHQRVLQIHEQQQQQQRMRAEPSHSPPRHSTSTRAATVMREDSAPSCYSPPMQSPAAHMPPPATDSRRHHHQQQNNNNNDINNSNYNYNNTRAATVMREDSARGCNSPLVQSPAAHMPAPAADSRHRHQQQNNNNNNSNSLPSLAEAFSQRFGTSFQRYSNSGCLNSSQAASRDVSPCPRQPAAAAVDARSTASTSSNTSLTSCLSGSTGRSTGSRTSA